MNLAKKLLKNKDLQVSEIAYQVGYDNVNSFSRAFKKETDMALGNLLGSCIFNIMSILGVTSVIGDIHDRSAGHSIITDDMIWMMGLMALVLPLMMIRKKIGRPEGVFLLLFYIVYISYLIIHC